MKPLKPVMAAILAASSISAYAITPDVTGAAPAVTDPASAAGGLSDAALRAKAVAHDKEFVARLVSLVDSKPEVRQDAAARLTKFILNRDNGRQYLTTGLLDDKINIKGAVKAAQDWPDTNKANPGKVADLYYVLGIDADKVPAWAPNGFDDEFKPNTVWSDRLAAALADAKWNSTKQVAQSGAANGTIALLDSAANAAEKILEDARTKGEIHGSIDANAVTAVTPPTTKASRNPLDASGAGSSFEEMYVKGAVVGNVYSPDDNGFRTLSMKVYTVNDGNGNYINKLGVVDITKPDNGTPSSVQWIDASKTGDTDIVFRDGGRHYTATVDQEGHIVLTRKGAKDGEGGSLKTDKDELSSKRDDQIASGGTVDVGGRPYYVLPQGGAKGSYLFFPQAVIDQMRAQHAAGLNPNMNAHPDLMGDVMTAAPGGAQMIKGMPDLGTLPNGEAYHLEFDLDLRMWKVAKGKGDTPKSDKGGGGDANNNSNANTNTNTSSGSGGQTGQPPLPDPKTLDEAIAQAKTQGWAEDAGNAGFDDASKGLIRIMSMQGANGDGMTHFRVLFDGSLGVRGNPDKGTKDNTFEFQSANNGVILRHIRGMKNIVVLDYSVGTQYYDLQNFANYVQHTNDPSVSYNSSGNYDATQKVFQDVTKLDVVMDILTNYLKSPDAMVSAVRSRIVNHSGGKGFVVSSANKTAVISMGVGENGWTIWPKDVAAGDAGDTEKLTGLRGPGTAVEVTGGAAGAFPKSMDAGNGRTTTWMRTENHAALYAGEEDENRTVAGKVSVVTVKIWSVMLEYKNDNGLPSRSKALAVFGTGKNRLQLPSTLHMQGLPDVQLPATTQLSMAYGSDQENGAIVAYRTTVPNTDGGSNITDKKGNCGGVVLWWGSVTKEKAQAACESDGNIK